MPLTAVLSIILAIAKMKHEKSQALTAFEPMPPVYITLVVLYLIFNPQLNSSLVQSV